MTYNITRKVLLHWLHPAFCELLEIIEPHESFLLLQVQFLPGKQSLEQLSLRRARDRFLRSLTTIITSLFSSLIISLNTFSFGSASNTFIVFSLSSNVSVFFNVP